MRRVLKSRRQRLAWLVFVVALSLLVYGFIVEPARLVLRDHVLELQRWPARCNGLRVDVITDVHTGSPRNGVDNLDRVVARLRASDAQIVLMAGDYVILSVLAGTYMPAQTIAEHLRPLTAEKQVYAVLGNHDWWKDGHKVSRAFASAGVHMIDNKAVPVSVRGCRFWLAGLGDLLEGNPDVAGTFSAIPADAPVIALSHEPALWTRIPARTALTIPGHTHGGQIMPITWLRPPDFEADSHLLRGSYRRADGGSLFVSPGIGTSILPMRLGVPPEISRLRLQAVRANATVAAATGR